MIPTANNEQHGPNHRNVLGWRAATLCGTLLRSTLTESAAAGFVLASASSIADRVGIVSPRGVFEYHERVQQV